MRQRQLSEEVKERISQAMKEFHRNRTETQKQKTREKQSQSMKNHWDSIPDGQSIDSEIKACKPCKKVVQPIKKQ
jgi:hypothetical protein